MVPSPTPVRAGTQGEGVVNALLLSTKQPVGKSDSTPAQQTPTASGGRGAGREWALLVQSWPQETAGILAPHSLSFFPTGSDGPFSHGKSERSMSLVSGGKHVVLTITLKRSDSSQEVCWPDLKSQLPSRPHAGSVGMTPLVWAGSPLCRWL